MKLEDPLDTWDFFMKTAGESYVTHVKEFQAESKMMSNSYMDSRSAQVEKRARVDLLDLKDQREGEAHIFFKSKLVRAKMFYANPEPVKHMRLNHFLRVEGPSDAALAELSRAYKSFEKAKQSGDVFEKVIIPEGDLNRVIDSLQNNDGGSSAIERAVAALLAFHERDLPEEPPAEDLIPEIPATELNLFTPLRFTDHVRRFILVRDIDKFGTPFLDPITTRESIVNAEQQMGRGEMQAASIGTEVIKDMQQATHYPPMVVDTTMPEVLADIVNDLLDHIVLRKSEVIPASSS
jgi:intracellular multiplication protein IcmO